MDSSTAYLERRTLAAEFIQGYAYMDLRIHLARLNQRFIDGGAGAFVHARRIRIFRAYRAEVAVRNLR